MPGVDSPSASLGLAYLTVGDDISTTSVPGIAAEIQLISGGFPHLGLSLMGNLKSAEPLAAPVLTLQLGRVP